MTAAAQVEGRRGRPRRRKLVICLCIALGVIALAIANAHLVYVAVTSQPDCVAHLQDRGDGQTGFRAARSAC